MIKSIVEAYRAPWRFMLAFPLLVAIPVVIEFVQHVIEIRGGMYVDLAGARAAEADPLRLGWGMVKTLSLFVTVYWVSRFMAGFDRGRVAALEPVAARLFGIVLLVEMALAAASLWGGGALAALGVPAGAMMTIGIGWFLCTLLVGILFSGWKVATALGNSAIGPIRSIALVAPQLPWSLAFTLVMTLPLMAAHYAIAGLAIGAAPTTVWALMAIDSLLVGYLACVLSATTFIMARRAAERRGVALQT